MIRSKILAIAIALLLMLSMSASTILLPSASAHTPALNIPTYAYINVQPNPVGIGQNAYLTMWIDKVPPTASGVYGDLWQNYTVTETKPDGTVQTLGPFISDLAGAHATLFTPDTLGNYTFVFNFGGSKVLGANSGPTGTFNAAYVGDYFEPSTSQPVTLSVTQEQIHYYPSNPLPTSYWTRPIYASGNLPWYQISGNWLGLAATEYNTGAYSNAENYNPYTTAPTTTHIMWTKPAAFGGVIGGEYGGTESGSSYYSNSHNEPKLEPIIINGVLYYTNYPGSSTYPEGWTAVNLRTGQTLWTQNYTQPLRTGQVLSWTSINQYGGIAYLWSLNKVSTVPGVVVSTGNTYGMYDAMTGNWILNVVNATGMTLSEAADGSLLGYYINSTTNTLNMWNSTACIMNYGNITGTQTSPATWRPPLGASIPFSYGIQWSVKLATNISGVPITPAFSITLTDSNVVLLTNTPSLTTYGWQSGYIVEAGYSGSTGQQLWLVNRTETTWTRVAVLCAQTGIYAEYTYETNSWSAYSITTGEKLWGPTTPSVFNSWDIYAENGMIAYGQLYAIGFGGDIESYNVTNGNLIWTFSTGTSGYETPYGEYPLWVAYNLMSTAAGGLILVGGGHEYNPPTFQGSQLYAINATTGKLAWSTLCFGVQSAPAVSDGIVVNFDSYDNQIYAFGMGPSKTTVTAPSVGVTTSTLVTISGTVTDISGGSQQDAVAANFPNGLPCVSDDSMTGWMQFVYQQQPCPTNVTGVPVTLSVLDSNGNFRQIGSTTSDGSGKFGFNWIPDIPGKYTVVANFAGSESYYPSSDEAFFTAGATAPTAAPTAAPVSLASTQMYVLGVGIAIIIIIVIVGAVLMLMLRKRP